MQVLTANQVSQLKSTATAVVEAAEIVDYTVCHAIDRFLVAATSDRALAAYRFIGKGLYHTVMLTCAAVFYAGVGTRELWNRFYKWADAYVEQCQKPVEAYQSVEVVDYSVPEETAIAHPEPVVDVWEEAIEVTHPIAVTPVTIMAPSIPLLPPAKIEPSKEVAQVGKKRRGRPRKVA